MTGDTLDGMLAVTLMTGLLIALVIQSAYLIAVMGVMALIRIGSNHR